MDKSIKLLSAAVALALLAPSASYATNGYFMIGAGAKTRGMGGAGIAYGQDSLAAAANPATAIDVGSRVDIGAEIFRPIRAVKHNSGLLPADEQSQRNLFLIPSFGISWQKNEKTVYNFVMMGAGLGTNYDQTEKIYPTRELATCPGNNYFYSFDCGATKEVGVDMIQVHMLPGMAYKMNDKHSFGVNLDFAINRFRARGLQSFGELGFSDDLTKLTNNGFDYNYGAGIRFGWQGKFNDEKVKLGAYYASKVFMTRFKKYEGLFAEKGKFDVPPHFGVGISVKATKKINVAFDIQYIQYTDVPSIANPGPNAKDPSDFNPLCPGEDTPDCKTGGAKGLGFGWNDQIVYKIGFDYAASNKMTWRFGFNYGKTPIKEDEALFNMLAPAVVEEHFTFGATYDWTKQSELSFNFMHAFKKNFQGKSAFYPNGVSSYEDMQTGNVALSMKQTAIGFSYGYKF